MQGGKAVYKSFGYGLQKIYREEGFAALYRGYLPRMVVVVSAPSSVHLFIYSLTHTISLPTATGPALRHNAAGLRDAEELHDPERAIVEIAVHSRQLLHR